MIEKVKENSSFTEFEIAMAALTERQRKFVELVIGGVPQTDAARAAGFAHKHAASQASHLMKDPKVARAMRLAAELKIEVEDLPERELLKKRLWEISSTGTAAARVQALTALDRIMEREKQGPSMPPGQMVMELAAKAGDDGVVLHLLRQFRAVLERTASALRRDLAEKSPEQRERVRQELVEEAEKILRLVSLNPTER